MQGGEGRIACPIHNGKNKNFAVNAETGQSICHSDCGRGWDILSLEQELTGADFTKAKAEVFQIIGRVNGNGHHAQNGRARVQALPLKPADSVRKTLEGGGWVYHSHADFGDFLRQVRFEHSVKLQTAKGRPEKTFVWEYRSGDDWFSGTAGAKPPIYFNTTAWNQGGKGPLLLVEGWGKANAADALGIAAASMKELSETNVEQLAGSTVAIWPDNDAPGRKMATKGAELLGKHGAEVFMIEPPAELPEGGDIVDAIGLGWDRERILGLIEGATRMTERPFTIDDLPAVRASQEPIAYLREPELPECSLIGITGDSGSGKSTLVRAWVRDAIEAGSPCLILDRESPRPVAADCMDRLRIVDGPLLRWWGGWHSEAPGPIAVSVIEWVKASLGAGLKPIVVVDSLIAFLGGDENDASVMRGFMNGARHLADMGATVIVIHHDGKADSARDFRGSSDWKASVDAAFHVTNITSDGKLDRLNLRCYKSRYGFSGSLVYRYAGGLFIRDERVDAPAIVAADQLTALLRTNPGVGTKEFEDLAAKANLGRNRARDFLSSGVLAGTIRRDPGTKNRQHHYLSEGE